MSIIRVSNLNPENSGDPSQLLSPQELDLVKVAVARAIDIRKVVGGDSAVTFNFATDGRRPPLNLTQ